MSEQKGIPKERLYEALSNAKSVMSKVDKGDYKRNSIDNKYRDTISNPDEVEPVSQPPQGEYYQSDTTPKSNPKKSVKSGGFNNIDKSNLPDSIKESFKQNPIQEADENMLYEDETQTLGNEFLEQYQRYTGQQINEDDDREDVKTRYFSDEQQSNNNGQQQKSSGGDINLGGMGMNTLKGIMKDVMVEVLNEQKGLLNESDDFEDTNEQVVIKLGDYIFKGKLHNYKKSKKK